MYICAGGIRFGLRRYILEGKGAIHNSQILPKPQQSGQQTTDSEPRTPLKTLVLYQDIQTGRSFALSQGQWLNVECTTRSDIHVPVCSKPLTAGEGEREGDGLLLSGLQSAPKVQ